MSEKPDIRFIGVKIANRLQCSHLLSNGEKFICGKIRGEWIECESWDNDKQQNMPFPRWCPLPKWEHNKSNDIIAMAILRALVERNGEPGQIGQLFREAFHTTGIASSIIAAEIERVLSLFVASGIATEHISADGVITWYALNPDVREIFNGGNKNDA